MATIRRRGTTWQAQVRRSGLPPQNKTFTLKTDAELWARHTEAELDRVDLPVDRKVLQRMTFGDLLCRYKEEITPTKRGQPQERDLLNKLLRDELADHAVGKLTSAVIARYRDRRSSTVQAATIRRELALVSHVLEVARKEWDVPLANNPVTSVRLPRIPATRDRRLESGELDLLLEGCRRRRLPLLAPIILFAVETAMRQGEIVAAQWQHADLERRTLHIPHTKNGHARTIPLSKGAVEVLVELPTNEAHIFPATGNAIRLAWGRLLRRVGVEDLRFHDLRHEAISRFFEKGLSVPEVALISGHRDYRMLFRYTHLRAEDIVGKL